MKATDYLQLVLFVTATFSSLALGCSPPKPAEKHEVPQAVRVAEVQIRSLIEGQSHLAEVVPERTVKVIAQVSGTVSGLPLAEGQRAAYGDSLVRVSAPDVAARVARVRSERKRAERERDFACSTLKSDRVLTKSGDLPSIALERSERVCASAELAVLGARAGEREATVVKARGVERAPFDGEVLMLLVDEGQTVMPGSALLQYASHERLFRVRVPQSSLMGIAIGGEVSSEIGTGRIVSIGAQAVGPGRVVEVLVKMDTPLKERVGTTLSITLVTSKTDTASAVPIRSLAGASRSQYIMVVEGDKLRRHNVVPGIRQDGWVAVSPALPKGTQVVAFAASNLDSGSLVMVVKP